MSRVEAIKFMESFVKKPRLFQEYFFRFAQNEGKLL